MTTFLTLPVYGDPSATSGSSIAGIPLGDMERFLESSSAMFPPCLLQQAQLGHPIYMRGMTYIVAGDEPLGVTTEPLTKYIDAATAENLKDNFLHLPRMLLRKWIFDNIYPQVPKTPDGMTDTWPQTFRMLWDYYGQVNNERLAEEKMYVWVWEYAKYFGWLETFPDQIIEPVYKLDLPFMQSMLRIHTINQYLTLEPIADFSLEYTRELSIKMLCDQHEYFQALSLIEASKNIDPDYAAFLTKELDPANNVLTFKEVPPMLMSDHPFTSILPQVAPGTLTEA